MPLKLPLSVKESGPVLDCHWPLTLILHGAKLYVDVDLESWHIVLLMKLFCQNIGRQFYKVRLDQEINGNCFGLAIFKICLKHLLAFFSFSCLHLLV